MRLVYEVQDRDLLILLIAVGRRDRNAIDRQADRRLVKGSHPASDSCVRSGLLAASVDYEVLACAHMRESSLARNSALPWEGSSQSGRHVATQDSLIP